MQFSTKAAHNNPAGAGQEHRAVTNLLVPAATASDGASLEQALDPQLAHVLLRLTTLEQEQQWRERQHGAINDSPGNFAAPPPPVCD